MKEIYEPTYMEVILFDARDVVTASNELPELP